MHVATDCWTGLPGSCWQCTHATSRHRVSHASHYVVTITDGRWVADVLGKVYGVVARRRGKIVAEEMKEGTELFTVSAVIPVVESFGFAMGVSFSQEPLKIALIDYMLDRNAPTNVGCCEPSAYLQRVCHEFLHDLHWPTDGCSRLFSYEMLDQDPFWVPTTEEELEDLGEKADRINIAKSYMDAVRERKGMFVDRKLVEFAEKQRTLKR